MRFWLTISLLLVAFSLHAGYPRVGVKLDRDEIKIGEQCNYNLMVDYRGDEGEVNIEFPQLDDMLGDVAEILERGKLDTLLPEKEKDDMLFRMQQSYRITVFDSGYHLLPPLPIVYNGDTMYSEAVFIRVNTVPVDTSKAFKDIKPIYEMDKTFGEWLAENWPWIAGVLAAILIGAGAWWYYERKKRRPDEKPIKKEPDILPHVEALLALSDLERKKIWQAGDVKEYYIELTDIIRHYIERRYAVPAMEQTTAEIVSAVQYAGINQEHIERLRRLLSKADFVKFAKDKPVGQDNELAMNDAREFVNLTKRAPEEMEVSDV